MYGEGRQCLFLRGFYNRDFINMKRFVIADLHLGHENIIKYCNRPFKDVAHMNETILNNWNTVVSNDDLVYVLGDFSMKFDQEKTKAILNRLNGRKILVMGNHDTRKPLWYLEAGFEQATRKPIMVEPGVILMHEPFNDPGEYVQFAYKYIFGHIHNKEHEMEKFGNCKCVSVERINYKPIDLDKLLKEMDPLSGEEIGY